MPVVAKQVGGEWRVVNADTGRIETNAAGTPVDGGGHATKAEADAQARAINASKDDLEEGRKIPVVFGSSPVTVASLKLLEEIPAQLDCDENVLGLDELGGGGSAALHTWAHALWPVVQGDETAKVRVLAMHEKAIAAGEIAGLPHVVCDELDEARVASMEEAVEDLEVGDGARVLALLDEGKVAGYLTEALDGAYPRKKTLDGRELNATEAVGPFHDLTSVPPPLLASIGTETLKELRNARKLWFVRLELAK